MTLHSLKIAPVYFDAVRNGVKRAEVRLDDRHFAVGDTLVLREYLGRDSNGIDDYTGRVVDVCVTHVLRHEDLPDGIPYGYAVLSIEVVE